MASSLCMCVCDKPFGCQRNTAQVTMKIDLCRLRCLWAPSGFSAVPSCTCTFSEHKAEPQTPMAVPRCLQMLLTLRSKEEEEGTVWMERRWRGLTEQQKNMQRKQRFMQCKEFVKFCMLSLSSAAHVRSWLCERNCREMTTRRNRTGSLTGSRTGILTGSLTGSPTGSLTGNGTSEKMVRTWMLSVGEFDASHLCSTTLWLAFGSSCARTRVHMRCGFRWILFR